ncbi:hypothetical protein IEO21_06683 [Rhodonia placenta]|uniref:Uncharacterized protein n=1 Tax=Rhodonia placenta TaxID=104341 RepID=A0A8H7NZG6_9APHY|nr:hypothetical protein IEO21_06683 [Postia placenta]
MYGFNLRYRETVGLCSPHDIKHKRIGTHSEDGYINRRCISLCSRYKALEWRWLLFALPALHPSKMGNNLSVDKRDAETDLQGLRDEVERAQRESLSDDINGCLNDTQVQEIALQTMQASLSVPDRSSYVPVPGKRSLSAVDSQTHSCC